MIREHWESYVRDVLPDDAPPMQIRECRLAFIAGATALFNTIMTMLDPGEEPTQGDLDRMTALERELAQLAQEEIPKPTGQPS